MSMTESEREATLMITVESDLLEKKGHSVVQRVLVPMMTKIQVYKSSYYWWGILYAQKLFPHSQ